MRPGMTQKPSHGVPCELLLTAITTLVIDFDLFCELSFPFYVIYHLGLEIYLRVSWEFVIPITSSYRWFCILSGDAMLAGSITLGIRLKINSDDYT